MDQAEQVALQAAAPAIISDLKALQQFETDMGPNPALWVVNYPWAKLKLLSAFAQSLPTAIVGEVGAGENLINATTSGWITKLQALQTPAPAASG